MDRSRPLWECYVIEGLADGRWAMLTKTHHATIDGASGVILLNMLTDIDPDAANTLEPVPWTGEPVPSQSEMLQTTLAHLASNPLKGLRVQLRLVRDVASSAGLTNVSGLASLARDAVTAIATRGAERPEQDQASRISIPITPAPATPWNRAITSHRRFAMRSTSLENIKALKDATGCTVNDIVMAICAGALREYLLRHDALPDKPLRAMVPVSIRTGEEEDPWTNRVSSIIAELPTNCADPLERVMRCHEAMNAAKRQMDLDPGDGGHRHLPVHVAGRRHLGDAPRHAVRARQPRGDIAGQRRDQQRARPTGSRCTSPAPAWTTTSRCRRSPTGWG